MGSLLKLRDYQREALDAVATCLADGDRPAVVLATGLGKTVVFSHQCAEFLKANPGKRVLIIVHTNDLVTQAKKKLKDVAPHLSVGIVKASLNQNREDVIIASRQTLGQDSARGEARRNGIRHVGLIIIDECHHAVAPQYQVILDHYKVPAVGYTATLARSDGKPLGNVWTRVAISRDILWGVRNGYLIMPRGKRIEVPDLHLATRRGDWSDDQIGDALAESVAPRLVVEAWLEHASDRKTIGFFPTVASAHLFAEAFQGAGVHCEVIHGGLSLAERDEIYARHKPGTVLLNCMVLTEGYDDPEISCVIQGRPTKSTVLYIQIVGRGLRPDLAPGAPPIRQQDCLVLHVTPGDAPGLKLLPDLSPETEGKPDRDNATLLDLTVELDPGEGVEEDETPFYEGPVEVKDFSMLGMASHMAWRTSPGGFHYLPAGKDAWVFLIERNGRYSVKWCTKHRSILINGQRGGHTEHNDLSLELAMSWAEDTAAELAGEWWSKALVRKKSGWRDRPPSQEFLRVARQEGVQYPVDFDGLPDLTAGELSDLIDTVRIKRLDALAARLASKEEAS